MLAKLDDAAKALGITPYALRKGARSGEFPHTRIGTRYMFDIELLKAQIQQRMLSSQKVDTCDGR